MPPAGFETTIPASELPQTNALDRAATGIGFVPLAKYYYSGQIKEMRWATHMACVGGRDACCVFVGKTEGRRQLGRPRRTWEDDIKLYHKES
jgi:hypothetical protein